MQVARASSKPAVGSSQPPVATGFCDHAGLSVVLGIRSQALMIAQQGFSPLSQSPQRRIPVFLTWVVETGFAGPAQCQVGRKTDVFLLGNTISKMYQEG